MCVCVYIYIYIIINIHVDVYVGICDGVYMCAGIYLCICTCARICMYACVCVCACMDVSVNAYIYIYIYIYVCVCVCVCKCIRMDECMYVWVFLRICLWLWAEPPKVVVLKEVWYHISKQIQIYCLGFVHSPTMTQSNTSVVCWVRKKITCTLSTLVERKIHSHRYIDSFQLDIYWACYSQAQGILKWLLYTFVFWLRGEFLSVSPNLIYFFIYSFYLRSSKSLDLLSLTKRYNNLRIYLA